MNKEHFKKGIKEIEFPQSDVFDAIDAGIKKGRQVKGMKRKSKLKMIGTISSVAATAFLASGLLFAPITNVLASVPIIGSIYEKFSLQIGSELQESNLITELNKEATSNGVHITVTSAYYDGNVIGLTFKAEGKKIDLAKVGDIGPEAGYDFHLFDGQEQKQWESSMTQLKKTEDGYVAAMEFFNDEANLPKNYTLPLTFSSITGIKGIWKFDVPVEQIPLVTINTDAESIFKDADDYSLQIESVIKGKATTLLKYKTAFPLIGGNDNIELTVFDHKGNQLTKSHADVLSTDVNNGVVVRDVRELFVSKISDDTKYLTIQPEISKHEHDTIQSLKLLAPFLVESGRFDYKIQVNSIEQNGKQLVVDYNVQNVDPNAIRKDLIQNFADFITIIKSEKIQKEANGNLNMNKMIEHQLHSKQAKVLDDSSLHFQSTFTIENEKEFNLKDYSLMVPFGSLSRNQPIEMEPIKIELDK